MKKEYLLKNKMIKEEYVRSRYWQQFSKLCPNCCCVNYLKPNADMVRCKICGTKIFRDEKTKFKYELGKRIQNASNRGAVHKTTKPKTK